ncbi:acetyl-CoA carboxylase biotin carboxyl carrier protein [Aquibacillus koreensis]|uniref:Biotin carboxyl carrier protein of acetyl-CoA carboxylase n=1 Tax=Aquibacillus koreensis TaxID=279446 RepID=A0A9X3WKV6_9BACI|nr:acetyl-CoA carboxylase biotin carboxyl carrier protein [Aquibacillus koreensis]MCT2537520.1 acetyl-CoA carboxylase biotin carboxyl carrier protein [Aquibacillus koreensis]MDC3418966.1 acetyl-CoA carboxylase biotin carboxyl carrier protein [Aquibacillus koreensis]
MLKIEEIHELIKRIDESSIDELTFETNETKLSLKKHKGEVVTSHAVPTQVTAPAPATAVVDQSNQTSSGEQAGTEQPTVANYDHEIVSPMVGTFYSSPSPDKDPFVQSGDKVKADTVVCIVEAMKLFNEIEAEVNGEIVEILVENGELVEYGQPLFRVKNV